MTSEPQKRGPAGSRRRLEESGPDDQSTLDQTGECSFPASDPPAVWTWEVNGASDSRSLRGAEVPDRALKP